MLFVLLLWSLATEGFTDSGTLGRNCGRFYEPVEVLGEYVPMMLGRKIGNLGLYSWRDGTWRPVLFQIDERTSERKFILPKGSEADTGEANGDFDVHDIIVFMARDAGDRAPQAVLPPGASSAVPIELLDPLTETSLWVYLAWYRDGTPEENLEPLARLADGRGVFNFRFPTYGYDALINDPDKNPMPTIYMNKLWVLREAGGNGGNIIDRQKVRGVITFAGGLIKIRFNESIVKGGVVAYKPGPVRILTHSCMYPRFPMGIKGPKFYIDSILVDTITLTTIIMHVPFNPGYVMHDLQLAFGIDLTPSAEGMRYYNSENPGGFLIDGVMDEAEKKYSTTKDTWRLITGPQGTQISSTTFDPKFFVRGKAVSTYNDNTSERHPPENVPGDIGAASDQIIIESLPAGRYIIKVFGCIPYDFYDSQGLNTKLLEDILKIRNEALIIKVGATQFKNSGCVPQILKDPNQKES